MFFFYPGSDKMVKFKILNPQNIMITLSDINFASTKQTSTLVTNSADLPIYIDNLKVRGTLEGIGSVTANSAHLAIAKRIEGAVVTTNVYDRIEGKDASLMLDRVAKQVPLFVTGQINPTVPFSLSQKFMIKLRKDDVLVFVQQTNPGSCNYSAALSWTQGTQVKRIMRTRRR